MFFNKGSSKSSLKQNADSLDHRFSIDDQWSLNLLPRENPQPKQGPPQNSNCQIANAAPLGQIGYAIAATVSAVVSLSGSPLAARDGTLAVVSLFMGGLAQLLSSLFALVTNNAFAGAVFGVYGLHWILEGIKLFFGSLQQTSFEDGSKTVQATYTATMFVVSICFLVPTVRMNRILTLVIGFIAFSLGFSLAAIFNVPLAKILSAVTGLCAGLSSLYLGSADLINQAYQKVVLPIFPHEDHQEDYTGHRYIPRRTYHKSSVSQVHM